MVDEWIYGAPPPPPTSDIDNRIPSRQQSNRGNRGGGGRNPQSRPRNTQFQPAMQFPEDSPVDYRSYVSNDATSLAALGARNVIQPSANLHAASSSHPREVQYNSSGYALSSTYNPTQQTTTASTKQLPAVKIQGTNVSLDTPEDIAAWIAERKKKWPTAANVEKRMAEKKPPSNDRSNKKRKTKHESQLRYQNDHPEVKHIAAPVSATTSGPHEAEDARSAIPDAVIPSQETNQIPSSSLDIALAALSGDIPLTASDHGPVTYDENVDEMTGTPAVLDEETAQATFDIHAVDKPSSDVSSDVSSETSSDSSDDDSDDELPTATSSKVAPPDSTTQLPSNSEVPAKPRRPCKYFKQGRCTRGDSCTYSHTLPPQQARTTQNKAVQRVDDRYKWRKRKSLYDRLVESELEQEKTQQKQQSDNDKVVPIES